MATPEELWRIVKKLPSDFEPYGQRNRETADPAEDCSCSCRHFLPLEGPLAADWGVCANVASPRCGLLTFEHMGCPQFESAFPADAPAGELITSGDEPSDYSPPKEAQRKLPLDREQFLFALEGGLGDETENFLDLQTGEIVTLFEEMDDGDNTRDKIEDDPDRYNAIEKIDSHESFRIMENFAISLRESGAKDRLLDALSRNKPFRRFKDAVNRDASLREHWFAFHDQAMTTYARDWLSARDIEPEWIGPANMA